MRAILELTTTEEPLTHIGRIASVCYGKSGGEAARAVRCWENGHMSVFEHVAITWRVEGISRACSHQLVRHRLASYTQASQRYSRVPASPDDKSWYVTPPDLEGDPAYAEAMADCAANYAHALASGIHPEDARYLLPEATETSITVTMNLREFARFHSLRSDSHAQWEIRRLAGEMLAALPDGGEWGEVRALILKGGGDA